MIVLNIMKMSFWRKSLLGKRLLGKSSHEGGIKGFSFFWVLTFYENCDKANIWQAK